MSALAEKLNAVWHDAPGLTGWASTVDHNPIDQALLTALPPAAEVSACA